MKQEKSSTDKGYFVYILLCSDGTFYTGTSNNVEKRVATHNTGKGAKYTKVRLPVKLLYTEKLENKSAALKREIAIKKLSRSHKEELLKDNGITW
ncbi:GIY-YIG nuclease family protein [Companilactobacillus mishanensis]|uniref:GIY-YIG nuclease family protein n=1 Tax=Companilactobacillus mishanensis TaxID=2486008 RepID=A0A5P0ZEN3_9LACO|nr:GIY-YIG nuclease family protein [Companilactobacillus mishanensis]MQS44392.1 GIY-YIG nuclease family protein [Companilactobacillus mishanensis]MQS51506.1 GIY-YIG nuclease family protein [Companilactobacillus mishanensis]